MTESKTPEPEYNKGFNPDMDMKIELYVNDKAEAIVFHDKPFSKELSWLEYDLDSQKLDFILSDGDIRNFGIPVHPDLAKYMQNAFQILMVQMDDDSGQPLGGKYFPLIIHRA